MQSDTGKNSGAEKNMLKFHIIAFGAGFILDLLFGDPYWLPHPIRLIGSLIEKLEMGLNGRKNPILMGKILVLIVLLFTGTATLLLLLLSYKLNGYVGCIMESIMTYQILATRCLKKESMKVYDRLKNGSTEEARKAVSMIVGRDTQNLNKAEVTKAAVETIAENTSDGVIAPMLYLAIGGPFLGFLYKAVNTMDSMIGYKNERYIYFGRTAAKLDDIVNFVPARISGCLIVAVSFIAGKDFDGKRACRIYRRDCRNHSSPNSGQTEAACAGALGIRLGGDTGYFGKIVKKPWIGDEVHPIVIDDIKRMNYLLYLTAWMGEVLCLVSMLGIFCISQ